MNNQVQDSQPPPTQDNVAPADMAFEDAKAEWERANAIEEERNRKELYFFYGSLMDPAQLQLVLGLTDRPGHLEPAEIVGYQIKMWGPYPALIQGPPGNVVKGVVYEVEGAWDKDRLADYETSNYRETRCTIRLEGGVQIAGTTFEWAGDMEDLKDGSFDLKDWQMLHLVD